MSTFFAPLDGATVNKSGDGATGGWVGGRWVPGSRSRATLHDVRITRTEQTPEEAPQPVELQAQPYYYSDAPTQAAANFTTQGNNMANNHPGGTPNPPDPTQFDMYDEESARDYNQQLAAYIDGRVASALSPSRQAQSDAELARQYNDTLAKYGDDANFKSTMDEALQQTLMAAKTGRAIDILQEYERASESVSRRPGQRLSHLPGRAKTVAGLGALIDFNHKSGRARPYRSR